MSRRSGSWTRELLELAALFLAVATADLFANSLAHVSRGTVVLAAMAVVLVVCAVVHHRIRHRRPTPESPEPPAAAMWRVRATVHDKPGRLAELAASLSSRAVNILSVQVHPVPDGVVDEFLVEARLPAEDIVAAVTAGGGWDVSVSAADTHDLVDIPTRILTMVGQDITRGTADGIDLARSARTLLGDCELRWDATGTPTDGPSDTTMRLRDPEGGVLTVSRPGPAFTPAEYARLHALLDLDAEFARWLRAQHSVVLLASGAELTVRQGSAADVPALAAMHERCSERARRLRYLGSGASPTPAALARLVNRRHGHTLVVEHEGHVVAMGNLMRDGDDSEVALLVEDSWQRNGIGTMLLRRLLTATDRPALAVTAPHNTAMLRLLHRAGAELTHLEPGAAHLTVR
ncbi:GNAT family N-acetyltransferase [Actinophytocola sp.]|uniref:GNAT family N-acetyltransferase n=1 Tax=Actinophytocola sp. TaxID=1872138 RepID=UPI002ED21A80